MPLKTNSIEVSDRNINLMGLLGPRKSKEILDMTVRDGLARVLRTGTTHWQRASGRISG